MFVSEITLAEIIKDIEAFCPIKASFNDIVLYNDYDSNIEVEDGVYGELYPLNKVAPNRIEKFKDYLVMSIDIKIVDFHHSIINIRGKKPIEMDQQ